MLQGPGLTPLLRKGPAAQELITAGWDLAAAAALESGGGEHATEHLVHTLNQAFEASSTDPLQRERITATRRRTHVV